MEALIKRLLVWMIIFILIGVIFYGFIMFCHFVPNIFDWDVSVRVVFLIGWIGMFILVYTYPHKTCHLSIYKYFNCDKENM